MIVLLVMTDGRRDCIEQTIASARENLLGNITRRIIHDDSGDPAYRLWLGAWFPEFEIVSTGQRSGFGGAIQSAWRHLRVFPGNERFVAHLEDDFTFNRPVPLDAMADVLQMLPHLQQMALRRQPWNDDERAAGGIVEQHPDDYTEHAWESKGHAWLEHRRFFTTNPSLYRMSLTANVWPNGAHSEGVFTHELLANPDIRFGFWGARDSGEAVTHIGNERVGVGY